MNKLGWIISFFLVVAICIRVYKDKLEDTAVINGVSVQVDTVIVHDTIRTMIAGKDIIVRKTVIATVDTQLTDSAGTDTAICYSFSQTYASGAYVQSEMCSRFFPQNRPEDLAGNIIYRPGNDTMKLFSRIDTIPKIVFKPPVIPTWKAVTLGLAGGILVGWLTIKGGKL